jgi:hypothetical protein
MGLYNTIFGVSHHAPMVLALLDVNPSFFGRFRDAWFEKVPGDDAAVRMVVYTRCGGGNRECHANEWDAVRDHPLYLGDRDDDFDATYAVIAFAFPAELPELLVAALPEGQKERADFVAHLRGLARDPVDTGERWKQAIAAFSKPPPPPPGAVPPAVVDGLQGSAVPAAPSDSDAALAFNGGALDWTKKETP